jgi:hypothetical protein
MIKFTQITFNPSGDSYDVFFHNDMLLFQGDYYHDKVESLMEGIQIYLHHTKEEFSIERCIADTKDDGVEFWDYDYQADNNVTLEKYLKRIEKDFNLKKL